MNERVKNGKIQTIKRTPGVPINCVEPNLDDLLFQMIIPYAFAPKITILPKYHDI
ncbi:TPA: hypothetical protein HA338_17760 [Methanosarcina acetivorans]|uniref:Uncharacterized protein n=1 Tax=Methanosarcina acetivorans TaxID=2214 RepID=A0A832WC20_9EURY|nr:hypothetical protein [Methanosarcina acetivorans]HIH95765.1 hypothetical protein [Methanosarcina acetivorans]